MWLATAPKKAGPRLELRPRFSVLLLARLLARALSRQRFLYPFFLAGLQVERVALYLLDDVLLLNLPLETPKSVFERFTFLQSDFCQRNCTPKPVRLDSSVISR